MIIEIVNLKYAYSFQEHNSIGLKNPILLKINMFYHRDMYIEKRNIYSAITNKIHKESK